MEQFVETLLNFIMHPYTTKKKVDFAIEYMKFSFEQQNIILQALSTALLDGIITFEQFQTGVLSLKAQANPLPLLLK